MRVNRMPPSSETLVTELSTSGVLLQPASANATAARQNASFLLIAALPEFPKPQMLRPDRAARKSNLAGGDRSWRICWEKRNPHGLSLTVPTAANKWGQTPLSPARDRAEFRSWPRIQATGFFKLGPRLRGDDFSGLPLDFALSRPIVFLL